MNSLTSAYEECRLLNRHYGTRFYHAMNLFSRELQPHIHGLCAFDRILLEMIRNPREGATKKEQLEAMKAWQKAFETGMNDSHQPNLYLRAAVHTTKIFDIHPGDFTSLVKARIADSKISQYDSYAQLKKHIDATAGKTASILCDILSVRSTKVRKAYERLARGGELIELIADAGNAIEREKCYLPRRDMARFGYPLSSLEKKKSTKAWKKLAEHYLKKAETEIEAAMKQAEQVPERHQAAFAAIAEAYTELITDIRRKEYDVFSKQPKLGWKFRLKQSVPALGLLAR